MDGRAAAVVGRWRRRDCALYVTNRFWGEAWLIAAHSLLAWPMGVLVPIHILGVIHASRRHRENLVGAMSWHGCKRDESPDT